MRKKMTETEKQLNKVLAHQNDRLERLSVTSYECIDKKIQQLEDALTARGIALPNPKELSKPNRPQTVLRVSSWETMCNRANEAIVGDVQLECMLSEEEKQSCDRAMRQWRREFNELHKLDKGDLMISVGAGILGALVDTLMVGIPRKTPEGLKGGPLENIVRDFFYKMLPDEEMKKLANSKDSKVPYDAPNNANTSIPVEGLSAYYHRMLSLGHDPLLGFVVGVMDIMTGKMTTIDKAGNYASQVMPGWPEKAETEVFFAVARQFRHFKSDVTTAMGLPAPLMCLFNMLQFGSIAEEEQTIAEIVQGMYYQGYDFIHFCSLSIPIAIVEVVTRIAYGIKRMKEGYGIRKSIPFSGNHDKHPKMATMLFVAYSVATAINAGKVALSGNPMAINYPQWLAFARNSYKQLKWALIQKPSARRTYLAGKLDERFEEVMKSVDSAFDELSDRYIVVID